MVDLNVTKTFLLTLFLFLAGFVENCAQIKESDPSTWPEPTSENIRDTNFYNTKKKLLAYYSRKEDWRKENLPDLYIMHDQLDKLKDQFRPFDSIGVMLNEKGKHITINSLSKIDVKDYSWIKQKLDSNQKDSPCLYLKDFFYNTYLVKMDSNETGATLPTIDCRESTLDDDDQTEYEIERQGDTLIILKFPETDEKSRLSASQIFNVPSEIFRPERETSEVL
ncbi:MAG: hypothetical protein HC819_19340 [Cyclobacteriaceae bacterium]|nr:hypothetical protein [Cyclobacteriaceae bacterium]